MIETHRSFANTWECDENRHINVQFFLKRFEEAYDVFLTMNGHSEPAGNSLVCRHVRFHREVHAGDSLHVLSGIAKKGEFAGSIVHHLINSNSGMLCTTAIDSLKDASVPAEMFQNTAASDEAFLAPARPRGLAQGLIEPVDSQHLVDQQMAMATQYNIIRSHDLDAGGNFLTSRVVSMFTDGAPHIWEKGGVTTQWLNETGNGRVAVEMKVCLLAKPEIGNALKLVSRISEIEGRTMRIDHQIERVSDGKVIAAGSVRCLVMNLTTRKAVGLPENVSTFIN